jgi:phage baseplate assembly protein W
MQELVRQAILHWEPRITLDSVTAAPDPGEAGLVHIHVSYTIRRTNARSNFVYPFYLNEATIPAPLL